MTRDEVKVLQVIAYNCYLMYHDHIGDERGPKARLRYMSVG